MESWGNLRPRSDLTTKATKTKTKGLGGGLPKSKLKTVDVVKAKIIFRNESGLKRPSLTVQSQSHRLTVESCWNG